ncbi:MAG: type II secretion system protein GspD [Nitrospirota bacterium]
MTRRGSRPFNRFFSVGSRKLGVRGAQAGVVGAVLLAVAVGWAQEQVPSQTPAVPAGATSPKISLDFKDVDLPILVKFFSELTQRNFVIDEKVRGKVTIFSPSKLSVDDAYRVFLSVLELKGFSAVPSGEVTQILPVAEVPSDRVIEVYPLAHATADELVKVLNVVVARPAQAGPARPGLRSARDFEGTIQVLADKPTNSLIVTGSARDLAILKDIIGKLDTARRQVYVEAVIMEVSVARLRELGSDVTALFGAQNDNLTSIAGFNETPPTFEAASTLDFTDLTAFNVRAVLRALQTRDDVNILSTPQILTSDNQKAEIVVGENRPFPTGQSQTTGGNTITTVERRDVGITLRLTPQILESNQVKLDVFQEISSVSPESQTAESVTLGVVTNKRSATTSVLVTDGQTAVIGGLIRDNMITNEKKIPLLGDIPLLGWLFKFKSKRTEKTNLLIFLTPTIVKTPTEMAALREAKSERMTRAMDDLGVTKSDIHRDLLDGVNPPDLKP